MTLDNHRQCENTRTKLRELEAIHEKKRHEPGDAYVRELTLRSLKKRINQLREEIARFETRTGTSA
jgi:uncharacterized small protein (DUF1192 family)